MIPPVAAVAIAAIEAGRRARAEAEAEAFCQDPARDWRMDDEMPKGGRRGEHSRRPDDRVPPSPTFYRPEARPVPVACADCGQAQAAHGPSLLCPDLPGGRPGPLRRFRRR